jgi:FAD:protein FMN transferase
MNPGRSRLFLVGTAVLLAAGCQAAAKPASRTEYDLLGTTCTITLYDRLPSSKLDAVFSRLREIEARMTVNRNDSEISAVNQAAGQHPVKVSADTMAVLQAGLEFSRLGSGAFDITIGPLVKLWGIGTDQARVPAAEEIRKARSLVGYRSLQLDAASGEAFLRSPGMRLDLGAIAKGYAADEAARTLRSLGVKRALINLGGNILTVGSKPDGSLWRIGIQNPEDPRGTYLGIVTTGESAVVTSGVYERFFEQDGKRYHHILDTKTGFPVFNGLTSVSIVTPVSMRADGFSTLLFALGLREGMKLAELTPGLDAIFVDEARNVYVTPGIRARFQITDRRFTIRAESAMP